MNNTELIMALYQADLVLEKFYQSKGRISVTDEVLQELALFLPKSQQTDDEQSEKITNRIILLIELLNTYDSNSGEIYRNLLQYYQIFDAEDIEKIRLQHQEIFAYLNQLTGSNNSNLNMQSLRILLYQNLEIQEAQELAELAFELLDSAYPNITEKAEEILTELVCLVPQALSKIQLRLAEKGVYYPAILYLDASDEVFERLSQKLLDNTNKLGSLLACLAWIGSAKVQELFKEWQNTPPIWVQNLRIPPEHYSTVAGWYLDDNGSKKSLFYNDCIKLVPSNIEDSNSYNPVEVITPLDMLCEWCNRNLVALLDINLSDERLFFLKIKGSSLKIPFCERCSAYAPIFIEVGFNGETRWSSLNKKPRYNGHDDEYPPFPERRLILGAARRTPYEVNSMLFDTGGSQIGGHPAWVQDYEYPECPGCHQLMPNIWQIQHSDIEEYREGTYYAFLCVNCKIATVNYQQT